MNHLRVTHEIFDKFHNKSDLKTLNVSDKLGGIRQISELNKVDLTQQICPSTNVLNVQTSRVQILKLLL